MFLLVFAFFVSSQVSLAADLKQLAEQLVNLTVKEVESVQSAGGGQAEPTKAIREGGRTVGAGQIREEVNKLLYKTNISKVLDTYNVADKERLVREIISASKNKGKFCKIFSELCKEFENPTSNLRTDGPPPYKYLPPDDPPCLHLYDENGNREPEPINEPCTEMNIAGGGRGSGTVGVVGTENSAVLGQAKIGPGRNPQTGKEIIKSSNDKDEEVCSRAGDIKKPCSPRQGYGLMRYSESLNKDTKVKETGQSFHNKNLSKGSKQEPGDYVDENGKRLSKKALDAFQDAHTEVSVKAIREAIERGNKSETAKKVLQAILENKIPCANCDGIEKLPDEKLEKIAKTQDLLKKEGWKIEVEKDRGDVKLKRVVKKKLFFLFDVDVEEEAIYKAELGEVEPRIIKKPWWSIFAW